MPVVFGGVRFGILEKISTVPLAEWILPRWIFLVDLRGNPILDPSIRESRHS